MSSPLRVDQIQGCFRPLNGRWVLPESELAVIHGMTTARLLQSLRPYEPLPGELCTYFDEDDLAPLAVQARRDGRAPLAFSEAGALAVGCLLGSPAAFARSIVVARAFARLRQGGSVTSAMPAPSDPVILERIVSLPRIRRRREKRDERHPASRRIKEAVAQPAPLCLV